MKIVVTGGAGFIGSNLVEELINQDNEICVIDNCHTGNFNNLKEIYELNKSKLKIFKQPCNAIDSLMESRPREFYNIDFVFHLGIPSSSPMYKKDRKLVGQVITEFIKILELARKNDCPVVYASTSSVYSGCPLPYKEDMQLTPFDFYTEARICCERLAKVYYDLYNVKTIGLRFFSVYGPKEEYKKNYANIITQFLVAMKKGVSPIIFGDGEQTRDFIYVKDVVSACILAQLKLLYNSAKHEIVNVGTGKSYSFNQVVEIINKILNKNITPVYIANPIKNYVQHTRADTTFAEKFLGFKAKYDLETGIREINQYYKKVGGEE